MHLPTTNTLPYEKSKDHGDAGPKLLDAISEGLHHMAQPLTVLRATLEIASGNACSVSQFQHAIDNSLVEVGRVTDAMGFVQELVRIAHDSSEPVAVDIAAVTTMIQQDLQRVLDGAGIGMEVRLSCDFPAIVGSASRLRQCLFYLLQHTIGAFRAGDVIQLEIAMADDERQIVVRGYSRNAAATIVADHANQSRSGDSRCLALAEALAVGQGGHLEWQDDPFAFQLTLVAADPALPGRKKPGRADVATLARNAI